MKKKKVLVLKGKSQYNVLRIATDAMVSAFESIGYEVTVLDLLLPEDCDRLNVEANKDYSLIFSFQALLFDDYVNDTNNAIFKYKNTLVFGHIVDHPIYHSKRMATNHGNNMYVGCIDRNHVDYINKFYKGVKNALYLPHGGFKAKKIIPYEERTINVFFPSSYYSPAAVWDKIMKLPVVYQGIANVLIKNMIDNPMLTLQEALSLYLDNLKFAYSEEEFILLMDILIIVDSYVRAYTRDRLITTLLKEGIDITVCGNGWDKYEFFNHHNLTQIGKGGVDFLEILEYMGNSKFVLNQMAMHQDGMHERIFTSMRCGAVCITNDFPIVHEEFVVNESVVVYTMKRLDLLANQIKRLQEEVLKAKMLANRGNNIAEKSHKWEDNVTRILEIVGLE